MDYYDYDEEDEKEIIEIDDISPFLFSKEQYLKKEKELIKSLFDKDRDLF